jgi:hypothetical protein
LSQIYEEPEQKEYASIRTRARDISRMKDILKKARIGKIGKETAIKKISGSVGRSNRQLGKGMYNTTSPKLQKYLGRSARTELRSAGKPVTDKEVQKIIMRERGRAIWHADKGGKLSPMDFAGRLLHM